MGQDLVYFSELHQIEKQVEYFDGNLILTRGNMIFLDKFLDKKILNNDTLLTSNREPFCIDKSSLEGYYFSDSPANSIGWLLKDKLRQRSIYFDREKILVKDDNRDSIILEMSKVCGFDVFTFSYRCGFLDASYDFSKGVFYFYKRKNTLLKYKKLMFNILTLNVEKT